MQSQSKKPYRNPFFPDILPLTILTEAPIIATPSQPLCVKTPPPKIPEKPRRQEWSNEEYEGDEDEDLMKPFEDWRGVWGAAVMGLGLVQGTPTSIPRYPAHLPPVATGEKNSTVQKAKSREPKKLDRQAPTTNNRQDSSSSEESSDEYEDADEEEWEKIRTQEAEEPWAFVEGVDMEDDWELLPDADKFLIKGKVGRENFNQKQRAWWEKERKRREEEVRGDRGV